MPASTPRAALTSAFWTQTTVSPNACQRIAETFAETDADVVTFGGYCNPAEAATPWITLKLSPRDVIYDGFSPDLMFKEQSTPLHSHRMPQGILG